jgi:hypothetical protein
LFKEECAMLGSMARGIVALAMLAGGSVSATGQEVDARTKQTGPRGGSVTRERSLDRGGGTATAARGTRIEGPRGAALERQIRIERGPGTVERSTAIVRPGGSTFERDVRVARSGIAPPAPGPRVIQRNLTINRCGPAFPPPRGGSFSNFSLFLGAPAFFPPPLVVAPVAVAAPPVVVVEPAPPVVVEQAPPAVVEVVPPQRYRSQPEAIRVDPVFEGLRRLHSGHDNSRRDGAVTLGRLGDGRAVKPLMDRLRFDEDRDVRAAAAWALGEIGDPQAAPYLERAAISDKKREVRDEAARALDRLEYVRSLPAGSEGAAPVVLPQPTRAVRPEVPPPPPPMPPGEERPIFEALPEALPDIDPGPAA